MTMLNFLDFCTLHCNYKLVKAAALVQEPIRFNDLCMEAIEAAQLSPSVPPAAIYNNLNRTSF